MLKRWAISFISFYQRGVSPFKPACCRFHPTCSEFAKISLRRFGVFRGGIITLRRLLRCHPFHPGGYDPVPYQAVVKR